VPEELQEVVLRALAKDPDERFPSARAFRTSIGDLKTQHPVNEEEVRAVFEVSSVPTTKIRVIKPGSTQDRIQKGFGVETTPARATDKVPRDRRTKPTTTEVMPVPDELSARPSPKTKGSDAAAQQVKALLLGAEKLLEARHFQEARLQLDAADSIDPESAEVTRLREAVDAADTVLQNRRKDAAQAVEKLLKGEDFEAARSKLAEAGKRLGENETFAKLAVAIDKAEAFAAERREQVANILATARRLLFEKEWHDVAPLAREALVLEPTNDEAKNLLKAAETGIEKERQAEERVRELGASVAEIRRLIDAEDPVEAQKALNVAHRTFGTEHELKPFAAEIESLRTRLEKRRAQEIVEEAEQKMQAQEFSLAIELLEEALGVLGDSDKANELLAGAREGLRLQEEAKRRQRTIDRAALSIDRLVLAGRLESAYRVIDVTEGKVGPFDMADDLRTRLDKEISGREQAQETLQRILKDVEDAVGSNRFTAAEDELAKARDIVDRFPEMAILVDEATDNLRQRASQHRRSMDVNAAVSSIRKRLDSADLAGAERELRLASRLYGGEAVFGELGEELEKARTRQTVDDLVRQAEESEPERALSLLEKALALAPDDDDLARRLSEVRSSVETEARNRRARLIEQAMEPIDALIAEGNLDEALKAVTNAVKELGDFPEAHGLKTRLQQMLEI
jgi:hypothetical protein